MATEIEPPISRQNVKERIAGLDFDRSVSFTLSALLRAISPKDLVDFTQGAQFKWINGGSELDVLDSWWFPYDRPSGYEITLDAMNDVARIKRRWQT